MRKQTVLYFVFDGFAEWEASYAAVGITLSEMYTLRTIAFSKNAVRAMGGMTVMPDIDFLPEVDLCDIDADDVAMLILPGGVAWEEGRNESIACLVQHCADQGIPVAAICGATLLLADMGLLDDVIHTSNDLDYLRTLSPVYAGHARYAYQPAARDNRIITASATGAIPFAREIFEQLAIDAHPKVTSWFRYFETATVGQ